MNDPGVPAIDEIEDAPVHIQPGITQGDKAVQIDQVTNQLGMRDITILGLGS